MFSALGCCAGLAACALGPLAGSALHQRCVLARAHRNGATGPESPSGPAVNQRKLIPEESRAEPGQCRTQTPISLYLAGKAL